MKTGEQQATRPAEANALELWGGVECTVNRVGEDYLDQLQKNGHKHRIEDLDAFAEIGLRTLRYPVLWEHVAPECLEDMDFSWSDERLKRLQELQIDPIVGLVHHGSGPRYTNLVDPHFPEKLAHYARAVAKRYPWVTRYTPVNEPLTTARFSCLYGLWFPHHCDDRSFLTALFNQIKGTVLAMRAIREINPNAQLVQTEDLGKTHSTITLAYQARFENARRWLTFDMLCGKVDQSHKLYKWLINHGALERELAWFVENPCPPDVIGVNHYVTSERYLDERVDLYPVDTHGTNGRHRYADVEAVRVRAIQPAGPAALLQETWERYGVPIAVTEAHLGCTREEQCRWLYHMWSEAKAAKAGGADIRAVTAWSLLGAYDWNSLLTQDVGHYEPGVYDLRGGSPRATALAGLIKSLAAAQEPSDSAIRLPGWWKRRIRVEYPEKQASKSAKLFAKSEYTRLEAPILIIGASGTLGKAFGRICDLRGLPFRLLSRSDMDIADEQSVQTAIRKYRPSAIVNCAGYVRVDEAENDSERCFRENTKGPAILAKACAESGVRMVTFSSDLVFDGTAGRAYVESDKPNALNVYGQSKAEAEQLVLELHQHSLVLRTSAFFGPWDQYNFVYFALRSLAEGREFTAANDNVVSPTYVPDLVHATLDLLQDGETGIWHLSNRGEVTWAELARVVAKANDLDERLVIPVPSADLGWTAPRPARVPLSSERGLLLPSLENAVSRFSDECESGWMPATVLASKRPAGYLT